MRKRSFIASKKMTVCQKCNTNPFLGTLGYTRDTLDALRNVFSFFLIFTHTYMLIISIVTLDTLYILKGNRGTYRRGGNRGIVGLWEPIWKTAF